MHPDDHTDARDPEGFDPQVTVVYDLPDAYFRISSWRAIRTSSTSDTI